MSDKVRIGIIGVGQIGKHHLDIYKKQVPDADLAVDVTVGEVAFEHFYRII